MDRGVLRTSFWRSVMSAVARGRGSKSACDERRCVWGGEGGTRMYSFIGGETDRLKFRIVTGAPFLTYLIDWLALPGNGSQQPHHAQHVTMKQLLFGICNLTEAMGNCLRTWRAEEMNLFELKFFNPAMQVSLRINVVERKLNVSGRLRGACGAFRLLARPDGRPVDRAWDHVSHQYGERRHGAC